MMLAIASLFSRKLASFSLKSLISFGRYRNDTSKVKPAETTVNNAKTVTVPPIPSDFFKTPVKKTLSPPLSVLAKLKTP